MSIRSMMLVLHVGMLAWLPAAFRSVLTGGGDGGTWNV